MATKVFVVNAEYKADTKIIFVGSSGILVAG